jgi:hypothetical protein
MTSALLLFLVYLGILAGQVIAVHFHIKKYRESILLDFGSEKNFWRAFWLPWGEQGKKLESSSHLEKIRNIRVLANLVGLLLMIIVIAA